jgi:putative FmdB family regulatory protein
MPLYEYDCEKHGVFESMQSMQHAERPERCPSCNRPAPRVLSAPRLACVTLNERVARDRNEKSRHEPRLATPPKAAANREKAERPALRSSHSSRPWVLEHS